MPLKDYISSKLNQEQAKAWLHTTSPSLIIAGAGSWKTRVLTYKIAYLFWWLNIPISRVLAVTFTNKAANEMKERLIDIWQEMEKNLQPFDLKRIGTFHSIFLKILKEDIDKLWMKYNKNFWILDTNDTTAVIREILKRLNLNDNTDLKPNSIKNFISTQKNNGIMPSDFLKWARDNREWTMWKIYQEYQATLERTNSLDFDDLLLLPYLLFKTDKIILQKRQNHFDQILVDEAQDTNRIQFELMKMMTNWWAIITMIWDDFQSIYGRRWALMENFLNVKFYRPSIQMFKLQTNYRSKPHIVQAGNAVIKNNTRQYEKNIIAHRTWDDKITIFSHRTDIDEAANTVELIKKMKNSWKLTSRWQVAILYRTNSQSGNFENIFLQEWIPYKIRWAFKFFERAEVKDILAYLRFFLNPQDNVSLKRIINIPNRKIWDITFEKLSHSALSKNESIYETISRLRKWTIPIEELKLTPQAMIWVKNFIVIIDELKSKLNELSPSDFISLLVKKISYKDWLIKEEWEEVWNEKYENIWQLINMASRIEGFWEEILRQFMEEVSLMSDLAENDKGELDAVKLMTVHSSKWLEFPMVFVVWLEDNIFPLSNSILDPKELEEERRLMYVAVTRAKDILFLSSAHQRMTRGQIKQNPPSRFLMELPSDLVKTYDLSAWNSSVQTSNQVSEWDNIKHKLFGTGYVMEVRNWVAIVKFHNPKFGLRKVEFRFLEII